MCMHVHTIMGTITVVYSYVHWWVIVLRMCTRIFVSTFPKQFFINLYIKLTFTQYDSTVFTFTMPSNSLLLFTSCYSFQILNSTGDQDTCYYNFRCAHPWSILRYNFCMPSHHIHQFLLFIYLFVYLSIYLSHYPSFSPSIHSSICPFIHLSIHQSFHSFIHLSIHQSFHWFICLSFNHLSIHLCTHSFMHPSLPPFIDPFHPSVYPFT